MRAGVEAVGRLRLVWVLVLVGTGCAELRAAMMPPPAPQTQVVQEQARVPSPRCPERIALDEPLEADLVRTLGARSFVPGVSLSQLGLVSSPGAPEVRSSFQSQLTLADGPVELVGVTLQSGAGLLLLRPEADGYCVVNTWSTWQSSETQYTLDSSWTSPDGRLAILLVKLVVAPGSEGEETRWVVLGTDGWRTWIALGTPPQHQLLAPSVSLKPKGKQLYLDVKLERTSRFALGKDGRFMTGQ
ncbi:hypothetical protein [Archangium lansingense]|uniref:Lipoprotein n=1 Tax=Archangium lansingense TaxID=2995310 RepID=A0ABT4AFQ1_9BACT|nr:hypothetical protein [Archangium lansinium]MCY1080503.1 hypothetical protein [Archangium lansinium]